MLILINEDIALMYISKYEDKRVLARNNKLLENRLYKGNSCYLLTFIYYIIN
jgi:hypothetical protein